MSSRDTESELVKEEEQKSELMYGIDERPPWYLTVLLAIQQFLMASTSLILQPLIIAGPLCLSDDTMGLGEFIGTVFFVGGLCSLLQTTFGIRLPIIQGASSSFTAPIIMLLKTKKDKCPDFNNPALNGTLPFEAGSDTHRALWQSNLTELQGALLVAALVEVFIGFSGVAGVLMRYIGPLTTSTVMTLIGLSLHESAAVKGSSQWWICLLTVFLMVLSSQYLQNVTVPFYGGVRVKIFLLFPVLLGVGLSWVICAVLTAVHVFPDQKDQWGFKARTDLSNKALQETAWFRIPYPGQWGEPKLSVSGVIAMMAAIFASTMESIGDYYACAKLCSVKKPPRSAISRGLGMEGICCLIAGALGTGNGFTSYSQNIASIGLTKVGSRVVIQLTAVMLLVLGCVGKVGAFFSSVPSPVLGGMIYVMFGMVTSIGISNLVTADFRSSRNLFVFGFSIFFSLSVPKWVAENPFTLGNETANEVLTMICGTSMLVGGIMAFVLDNTMPGTLKERGIVHQEDNNSTTNDISKDSTYDLPLVSPLLHRFKCFRYVPFCPGFEQPIKDGDVKYDHVGMEMDNNGKVIRALDRHECNIAANNPDFDLWQNQERFFMARLELGRLEQKDPSEVALLI